MAISTTSVLSVATSWNQGETDPLNANNVIRDVGQLAYSYSFPSGSGTGALNEVFHALARLSSGGTTGFNLQSLSQTALGYTLNKSFSDVYSLTFKNHSTTSGFDVTINVTGSSDFKEPFGAPVSGIVLGPLGSCHVNRVLMPFIVNTNNRYIGITDRGSGATFELVILGHR